MKLATLTLVNPDAQNIQVDLFSSEYTHAENELLTKSLEPASISNGSHWISEPENAFRSWKEKQHIHRKEFTPHSIEQYQTMFNAYLRWLKEKCVEFTSAKAEHLDLFIASKNGRNGNPASPNTRRRY